MSETVVARLNDFKVRLAELTPEAGETATIGELIWRTRKDFEAALDDDLNVPAALGALHDFVRETNSAIAAATIKVADQKALLDFIDRMDSVFGIFGELKKGFLDADIQSLIDERQAARKARNFVRSDEIRNQLTEMSIVLEDTKEGVRWKRK